jgi:hypothetical protein
MGKSICYTSKNNNSLLFKSSVSSNPKLTDEYIINLINENPELDLEELAKLANVSI